VLHDTLNLLCEGAFHPDDPILRPAIRVGFHFRAIPCLKYLSTTLSWRKSHPLALNGFRSLPAVIGVACGAAIASFAPAAVLTVAFVLVASFIAIKLLFAGDRWNLGDDLPGPLQTAVYGFDIGFFGSLMGVSGGAPAPRP
jgi:uncharacterized membrane protein YfcA